MSTEHPSVYIATYSNVCYTPISDKLDSAVGHLRASVSSATDLAGLSFIFRRTFGLTRLFALRPYLFK